MKPFKVIWSLAAEDELIALLEYIEMLYGSLAAVDVLEKVERIQEQLEQFPELYPKSAYHEGLRKAVVSKQFSLLYVIHLQEVKILYVWDNRKSA
jgi:plasmid stabilization system protein ParE